MADEFEDQLRTARSVLIRLQHQAQTGEFTVGDDVQARTPENIKKHVAGIQLAIDDIDRALKIHGEADQA